MKILDFSDEQLAKADGGRELWTRYVIKAGTYPGQTADVNTIAQPNFLAVSADISAQLRDTVVPAAAASTALLSAHMIVFWLSQDSNVTPPVCLAAFTAAAIAKSPTMMTGVQSWKLAKGLYIVPVLFAYTPLLSGDWGGALLVFFFAVFGIYARAAGMQGCMERPLNLVRRALAMAAGVACLWPFSLVVNVVGATTTAALLVLNMKTGPKPQLSTP